MAEFVALFYTPWFFKSSMAADSPLNDLDIIDDVRKLRDVSFDEPRVIIAAEKCLESIYRHSKYLYSHLVVMAPSSDKGDRRRQEGHCRGNDGSEGGI